ncbi:hypothetical protein OSB04_026904 [Centaurea solstitialis]|uniref:Uncharacterized protein n=1 Tax=Centaurea solstitialis TaxID=347529 RepID=A0AA38SXS8_9ASTR|nr:hypothetical protein OSB04_026904 [Centaurea solstitialis]
MTWYRLFEGPYRIFARRNYVNVTFVIVGAFFGERVACYVIDRWSCVDIVFQMVDYGIRKLWEKNNVGKRFEDISVLGERKPE